MAVSIARLRKSANCWIAIAARIPSTATTTINSRSVNPASDEFGFGDGIAVLTKALFKIRLYLQPCRFASEKSCYTPLRQPGITQAKRRSEERRVGKE